MPQDRSDLAEAGRMLLRTVLPVGVVLGLALAVYGGTGHDLTIVLQDRFPEDSDSCSSRGPSGRCSPSGSA